MPTIPTPLVVGPSVRTGPKIESGSDGFGGSPGEHLLQFARTDGAVAALPTNDDLIQQTSSKGASDLQFTGERVIPGLVETQLFNEHVSRYRFACLFAQGRRVLDVGCGTGYGTELLGIVARTVIGFDIAPEAARYASRAFADAEFLCASADSFPVKKNTFDVVTAFEVIEHLNDWSALIEESSRVLADDGVFLVSTPNIDYYAEARGPSGPNPFHTHEFTLQEFQEVLGRTFPFVEVVAQNQGEAVTFASCSRAVDMSCFIPPTDDVGDAHFYLAVCSRRPIRVPYFADISSTRNLLRDRERHVRGLQGELRVAEHQYASLLRSLQQADTVQAQTLRDAQAELEATRAELKGILLERSIVKRSGWVRLGLLLGVGPWSTNEHPVRRFIGAIRRSPQSIRKAGRSTVLGIKRVFREAVNVMLLLLTHLALALVVSGLAMTDLCFRIFGRKRTSLSLPVEHLSASVIIPTWNGADLLRRNLPSVLRAAIAVPGSEVIVVDDGSTDDTYRFIESDFPQVRLLRLAINQGFARACNAGAALASNDVIIFLNNDMRVSDDFVSTLLRNFTESSVFAVTSQIFFAAEGKLREETGLTEVWWENGNLSVGHRIDPSINSPFPCAYPGGGSSAFDRAKFLELGGFDSLFHPFYYEDTDLGYRAWKRGWQVLYEPTSIVYHEHRGTVGQNFSPSYIDHIVRTNQFLYTWKNIHSWGYLAQHFAGSLRATWNSYPARGESYSFPKAIHRATCTIPALLRSRWQALQTRETSDQEALRRPLGGYFRDRFRLPGASIPRRLNVLMASPYPIEPATHGGAVFMREAVHALASLANVHLVSFVDREEQLPAQEALLAKCKSATFLVRPHVSLRDQWTLTPNAIREFAIRDFAWALHRTMLLKDIDVLQLEYTTMGQYAGEYKHVPCLLFEHDISAQSLWRRLRAGTYQWDVIVEWFRMRLYEPRMLKRVGRIQVCSPDNKCYLKKIMRGGDERIDSDVRASIDVRSYPFRIDGRQQDTLLFVGSFRHAPNMEAIRWFNDEVLPLILKERPQTVLYVVGSDAPAHWEQKPHIRLLGEVPDIKEPLSEYCVFICPILVGSGIRVKLLEAFASGIPAVATTVGAEGLSSEAGPVCEIADTATAFAESVLTLLTNPLLRRIFAENARRLVEQDRDSRKTVLQLEATYRTEVGRMRPSIVQTSDRVSSMAS